MPNELEIILERLHKGLIEALDNKEKTYKLDEGEIEVLCAFLDGFLYD